MLWETGTNRFALYAQDKLYGYVTRTFSGWAIENARCTYSPHHRYPSQEMAADILAGKVTLRRDDKWEPRDDRP